MKTDEHIKVICIYCDYLVWVDQLTNEKNTFKLVELLSLQRKLQ